MEVPRRRAVAVEVGALTPELAPSPGEQWRAGLIEEGRNLLASDLILAIGARRHEGATPAQVLDHVEARLLAVIELAAL